MYESPIKLTYSEMCSQIVKKQEEDILQAVVQTGVNINKEELIKALSYDRNQYNKGFADGVKEFAERLKEKCYDNLPFNISVHPDDINNLLKEIVGDSDV